MKLFSELKRRNVLRVAAAYAVVAWLIVQVGDVAADNLGFPDWFMPMLFVLVGLGFPVALFLAWAFELTPEGLKRETDVSRSQSSSGGRGSSRKLDMALLVMLVVVAVLFAFDLTGPDANRSSPALPSQSIADVTDIDSIAVLPFEDFSAEGDQKHLGTGLADSILHMLAQVPDLRVAARTSSFYYQGKDVNVATIGQELGVGAVLEGSIQRSGGTLRIIAQLIRVADQSHLWSDTFDRPTGDIFAIQDEISREVARILRPAVEEQTSMNAERTSIEAYEHFVLGDQLWRERTQTSVEQAIDEFKAAIADDPDYAQAHAGLAMAYVFSRFYGSRSTEEIRLVAEQSIERALALDPDNALAFGAKGQLQVVLQHPSEAAEAFRRAVALNPSDATVHAWLAYFTTDPEEASPSIERAYALDPLNLYVINAYAEHLAIRGNYELGLEIARRGVSIQPDAPLAYAGLARTHLAAGHFDDAIRARLLEIERSPETHVAYFVISHAFNSLGDRESTWAWFSKAQELNPSLLPSFLLYLNEADLDQIVPAMQSKVNSRPNGFSEKIELCVALTVAGRNLDAVATCGELINAVDQQNTGRFSSDTLWAFLAHGWASGEIGQTDQKANSLERFEAARFTRFVGQSQSWTDALDAARIAALKGDQEGVIENLELAFGNGFVQAELLNYMPWWQPYSADPAFKALLEKIQRRRTQMLDELREQGI